MFVKIINYNLSTNDKETNDPFTPTSENGYNITVAGVGQAGKEAVYNYKTSPHNMELTDSLTMFDFDLSSETSGRKKEACRQINIK